jgi:hypothetical protein
VLAVHVVRPRCVGFVALGRESLAGLDLTIHNVAGVRLAEDLRGGNHPYVRVCGRAGDTEYVSVRASRGAGEVAVLALADPPLFPPNLDAVLGSRSPPTFNLLHPPRVSLGPDPAQPGASERLEAQVQRLLPLGYRRVGPVLTGTLPAQRQDDRVIALTSDTCYTLVAAGGQGVDDLDLRLVNTYGRLVAEDRRSDSRPTVKLCPRRSGAYHALVHMYAGQGSWSLAVLAMDRAIDLPEDVVGLERALALELAGEGRRHGMALMAPPMRGAELGGQELSIPLPLRAGRCYLFGAAAGEPLPSVELSLVDDRGAVVASDTGETPSARVYHCARRDERARVAVRASGRGEFVFLALEGGS